MQAEIPRVRMNPENPTGRKKQEHEDSGHAVYRSSCAVFVEGRGVGGQHRIELLEEEERERTTPIVAFDHGFLLQDAVIHACVKVEVISQGPPEGDHMANDRVEMAVREVKRQCRTFRISAEHNTGMRIADGSPLLNWLHRFAAHVMNKKRIGKDGKTSELRRTGRSWRKAMTQFGENVWFRKTGEDGVSSFASRMTQGCWSSR